MRYSDFALPQQKIITIRYRDKYVDLVSDTDHYGTMTQNSAGDRVEFDFSQCRVIGVREVPVLELPLPATEHRQLAEKRMNGNSEVVQ